VTVKQCTSQQACKLLININYKLINGRIDSKIKILITENEVNTCSIQGNTIKTLKINYKIKFDIYR